MRYIINFIKKKEVITQTFSYGRFLQNNPNASKQERLKAVKKFLDKTR